MNPPTRQADRHVEAVLAALDILDCFVTQPALDTRKLIDLTGFTRNRVTRLTGTLIHKGYLHLDPVSGAFEPGPKLLALGQPARKGLLQAVRAVLQEVALSTGESASFYVRDGLERVVLARAEGTQAIRYTVAEGQRMDLRQGASGKTILAFSAPEVLDIVLQAPPANEMVDAARRNPETLREELHQIREAGYAVSRGERVPDACGIAAPVFNAAGELEGALGLGVPQSRFTLTLQDTLVRLMRSAAEKLSRSLGWTPDTRS